MLNANLSLLIHFFGAFFFVFTLWKKLKEDYYPERIFNTAFIIISALFLASFLVFTPFYNFTFWFQVVVVFVGTYFLSKKFDIRLNELFDALIAGILPWLVASFLFTTINLSDVYHFIFTWVLVFLFAVYIFLNSIYKKITWYQSGKLGLSAVVVTILFFISRAIISLFNFNLTTFVAGLDLWFSVAFAFVFFLLLLRLSKENG